jgi:regulator of protease activity HflC (stomatin/prohibitin superfamily)
MWELLLGLAAAGGLVAVASSVRILREYQRAVVFRLGRARARAAGPGVVMLAPFGIDRVIVVDTRTKVMQIPAQEVITHDNVSCLVDAVVYADVASPSAAVLKVEQYMPATLQLAATTLRSILGKMDLDDILAKRSEINDAIRQVLDQRTEQWGVEITAVEIKDITLPQEMKRAMARQAEAERERRAKVIMSEGELQAAEKLAQAAATIGREPAALQLRLYQTLVEVSSERNNTIVFPVPMELLPATGASTQALAGLASAAATALASQSAQAQLRGAGAGAGAGAAGGAAAAPAALAGVSTSELRAALDETGGAAPARPAAPPAPPRSASRSGGGSSSGA